jgi:hypothetical protein
METVFLIAIFEVLCFFVGVWFGSNLTEKHWKPIVLRQERTIKKLRQALVIAKKDRC